MRSLLLTVSCVALVAQAPEDPNLELFISGLQKLSSQDKNLKAELDTQGRLFKLAMSLDSLKTPALTRVAAAKWLITRNTTVGYSYSGKTTYLQATKNQPDLLRAWDLLDAPSPIEAARTINALKLEISWRLLDLDKMRASFDKVSAEVDPLPRELVHSLLAAIHLGEWEVATKYATLAQSKGMDLQGFHKKALNNLTSFDYESIVRALNLEHPVVKHGPLSVCNYRVIKWKCRPKSISGGDQKLVGPLADQINPKLGIWIDHAESKVGLLQVGAATHWIEDIGQPPVSGFKETDRIFLVGYFEPTNSQSGPMRQNEIWDMRTDPTRPGTWVGTNTMIMRPVGASPDSPPALQLVMEHEWQMTLEEEFRGKTQPK